jgi:cytochrome P450
VNVAHPWTWKQLLGAHSLSVAVGDDHARKRAVLSKAFTPTYTSYHSHSHSPFSPGPAASAAASH